MPCLRQVASRGGGAEVGSSHDFLRPDVKEGPAAASLLACGKLCTQPPTYSASAKLPSVFQCLVLGTCPPPPPFFSLGRWAFQALGSCQPSLLQSVPFLAAQEGEGSRLSNLDFVQLVGSQYLIKLSSLERWTERLTAMVTNRGFRFRPRIPTRRQGGGITLEELADSVRVNY